MFKKLLAITLSIIMVFSLVACGEEEKAEKYCSSCGGGILKSAAYCEHCGTAVGTTQTTSNNNSANNTSISDTSSDNISSTESSENSSSNVDSTETQSKPQEETVSKPTETSKPNEATKPTHTHSYSKNVTSATCTKQGYTTYTCPCGDTYKENYTNPSHSYSNYQCTTCGIVDNEHAYEYLLEFVKYKGTTNGEYIDFSDWVGETMLTLSYSVNLDTLCIFVTNAESNTLIDLSATNNKYTYYSTYGNNPKECIARGKIDGRTFTDNSPISCDSYEGDSSLRSWFMELTRLKINLAIKFLNECFPGISVKDLGFTSY